MVDLLRVLLLLLNTYPGIFIVPAKDATKEENKITINLLLFY
jgi:hypothetical protein